MSAPDRRNLCVVLQQVDRSNWCVVRRKLVDGKLTFASRIATARPFKPACALALAAAEAEGLRLVFGETGKPPRKFDPQNDTREPRP
ncbi:hypothetical protein C8J46_105450 [Sphingomonas sp. PP-F2F-A104-K0414]|uniref:hypothetical protein n=1 Tax=Sphingomonas sp. PP-F2F-A104-K0414 TaxID=2135661 RepID=UPI00104FDCCB|nr:hypothetical protein [Sphingomonas sp. PP-F2F-A104-K0414]TCP98294.1 hypothetical protein C8J46_105450 [Sphingomonas sp. PP-F2F-A104-K0414]